MGFLKLEQKSKDELIAVAEGLRVKFMGDYATLKGMEAHLPRVPEVMTPAFIPLVADATAQLREKCSTAGNIELRWLQVHKEVGREFNKAKRVFSDREAQAMAEHQAELKAFRSVDERQGHVRQFLRRELEDLEFYTRLQEEAAGWHDYCRRRYALLKDAQEDGITMTALLKQAHETRSMGGPVLGVSGVIDKSTGGTAHPDFGGPKRETPASLRDDLMGSTEGSSSSTTSVENPEGSFSEF